MARKSSPRRYLPMTRKPSEQLPQSEKWKPRAIIGINVADFALKPLLLLLI
jgi:hypothetical protein